MNTTLIDDAPADDAPREAQPGPVERVAVDRRQAPSPWYAFRGGRRKGPRRDADKQRPRLVDRMTWPVVSLGAGLVGLSLFDALATVKLMELGCDEANPFMRLVLQHGFWVFLLGKLGFSVAAVWVLLGFRHHTFCSRLRVGHLLLALNGVYLTLAVYEVVLLRLLWV